MKLYSLNDILRKTHAILLSHAILLTPFVIYWLGISRWSDLSYPPISSFTLYYKKDKCFSRATLHITLCFIPFILNNPILGKFLLSCKTTNNQPKVWRGLVWLHWHPLLSSPLASIDIILDFNHTCKLDMYYFWCH